MAAIEKKYLQAIENTITKSITKHVLKVIPHLFMNYGQVHQTTLNEHNQRIRATFYTMIEPLRTIFAQIEDLRMLVK